MVCGISYKYQFLPTLDLNLEFFRFRLPDQTQTWAPKPKPGWFCSFQTLIHDFGQRHQAVVGHIQMPATDAIYRCSQVTPDSGGWWWHGEIFVFWLGRRGDVFWKWEANFKKNKSVRFRLASEDLPTRDSITPPKQMNRNLKLQELLGTVWDTMIMEQNSVKQNGHVPFVNILASYSFQISTI